MNAGVAGFSGVWIGLDLDSEGVYKWSDGTPMNFTK